MQTGVVMFVPMFMLMGYSPALIQMAYRIGDAITNSVCPMNAMLGAIIGYYTLWKPKGYGKVGLGTIMVIMTSSPSWINGSIA